MRILDRYLIREFITPFSYCVAGFFVFWSTFDIFAQLEDFQKAELKWIDVAEYYLFKSPQLLGVIIPMALLLALLYALTNHARHEEITAMKSAGINDWRIYAPYLATGVLCSVGLVLVNEAIVPESERRTEEIMGRGTGDHATAGKNVLGPFSFRNDASERVWFAQKYYRLQQEMESVDIKWKDSGGGAHHLLAGFAKWTNQNWRFYQVTEFYTPPGAAEYDLSLMSANDVNHIPGAGVRQVIVAKHGAENTLHFRFFDNDGRKVVDKSEAEYPGKTNEIQILKVALAQLWDRWQIPTEDKRTILDMVTLITDTRATDEEQLEVATMVIDELTETPEQIESEIRVNGASLKLLAKRPVLPIRTMLDYRRLHPDLQPPLKTYLSTQLHSRVAYPWTCLVVVMIALPCGSATGRRNTFWGVASSVLIFFSFLILAKISMALGVKGLLPAWIAAWTPNLVFAGFGILWTLKAS